MLSRCCVIKTNQSEQSDIFDHSFRLFLVCSDPNVAPARCLKNIDTIAVTDLRPTFTLKRRTSDETMDSKQTKPKLKVSLCCFSQFNNSTSGFVIRILDP